MTLTHEQAVRRLPSRLLMDPLFATDKCTSCDVWGLYPSTEASWLATYHFPSATHIYLPGFASFWVLPSLSAYQTQELGKLGIAPDDAPLAMFGGLVSESLSGHRDNEDVIKAGWAKLVSAYEAAASANYGALVSQVVNARKDEFPVMKLDARSFKLWPEPGLYGAALAILQTARQNQTSYADALATIRDTVAVGADAKKRFNSLALDHEANELLAHEALASDSPALTSYAAQKGISVEEARHALLCAAGANPGVPPAGARLNARPSLLLRLPGSKGETQSRSVIKKSALFGGILLGAALVKKVLF